AVGITHPEDDGVLGCEIRHRDVQRLTGSPHGCGTLPAPQWRFGVGVDRGHPLNRFFADEDTPWTGWESRRQMLNLLAGLLDTVVGPQEFVGFIERQAIANGERLELDRELPEPPGFSRRPPLAPSPDPPVVEAVSDDDYKVCRECASVLKGLEDCRVVLEQTQPDFTRKVLRVSTKQLMTPADGSYDSVDQFRIRDIDLVGGHEKTSRLDRHQLGEAGRLSASANGLSIGPDVCLVYFDRSSLVVFAFCRSDVRS